MTSEEQARKNIDALLLAAGWHICDVANANIHAAKGVAIREFPLDAGFGFADYLLYIDGKAAGVIEAKKEGMPLTGVEIQSSRYAKGLFEVRSFICFKARACAYRRYQSEACGVTSQSDTDASISRDSVCERDWE